MPSDLPCTTLSRLWSRFGAAAARAFAGACGLAVGAACADEPLLPQPGAPDVPATAPATAIGLDAISLMQLERREQRGVPRMLPLASTPASRGRLWLGLARERSGSGDVRLELVWVVPLGR